MAHILNITAPIFLLMAVGYLAVRLKLLPADGVSTLGAYILNLAIPALIVTVLAKSSAGKLVNPMFILVYALGALTLYLVGYLFFRYGLKKCYLKSIYFGLGASFPNTIIIGFPLLNMAMERSVAHASTMAVLIENIILLPMATMLLEFGTVEGRERSSAGFLLARLYKSPVMVAVIIGICLSLISISIPETLSTALEKLSATTYGASLIYIGALLACTSFSGSVKEVSAVVFLKLVIHPLIVAGLIFLLPPFDRDLQITAIVLASIPMFGLYPVIGHKYGLSNLGVGALLYATPISFLTVSCVLYWAVG